MTALSPTPHAPQVKGHGKESSRRTFLASTSVAIQGLLAAAVAVPWVGALAFPLWGKVNQRLTGFVSVGAIDRFKIGIPSKVVIRGNSSDAWSRQKDVSLGAAWVVRTAESTFDVFSTTCPHLGCAVNFDSGHDRFLCPCHGSHFALNGSRKEATTEPNPSPRDMDLLEWKIDSGQLLVRYARFRTGTAERITVG